MYVVEPRWDLIRDPSSAYYDVDLSYEHGGK